MLLELLKQLEGPSGAVSKAKELIDTIEKGIHEAKNMTAQDAAKSICVLIKTNCAKETKEAAVFLGSLESLMRAVQDWFDPLSTLVKDIQGYEKDLTSLTEKAKSEAEVSSWFL
jgi:hypothetical protein